MKPLRGVLKKGQEGKVLRLKKGLYGLKQAGRGWYQEMSRVFVEEMGLMLGDVGSMTCPSTSMVSLVHLDCTFPIQFDTCHLPFPTYTFMPSSLLCSCSSPATVEDFT